LALESSTLIPKILFPPVKKYFDRNLQFILSNFCFDRKYRYCCALAHVTSNTIGESINSNYTHSGRTTPSIIGGVNSGRASALTIDSNATGAISFNMQPDVNNVIHPIPHQGLLSVLDPDMLPSKKVSVREKGTSAYTAVEHVALLSIISEIPDAINASESSSQWE
jgi:hypothetical protein